MNQDTVFGVKGKGRALVLTLAFLLTGLPVRAQQILWAKLYALPKTDQINCIVQDQEGNLYSGGHTWRGAIMGAYVQSIIYKLNSEGDTIFSHQLGIPGDVETMAVDPFGIIRIFVRKDFFGPNEFQSYLLSMTPEGFVFKIDTINRVLYAKSSILAKDSSWVIAGFKDSNTNPNFRDMFFLRVDKDGTVFPYVSLNPNHPDCGADRVEQLPNGKYLVSGHVGSRVTAYTLDEDGSNPQYEFWYQTPDLSFLNSGHVGQAKGKKFILGAQGNPSIVGLYDSLKTKIWLKKDTSIQIAPQAMTDGSILIGNSQRPNFPTHTFLRIGEDSSIIWFLNLRDSLAARGLQGNLYLIAYTYFEDQSAVVAATLQRGTVVPYTAEDPFFIKIANVGTPVTSLLKPKKGPLANETLAPWPNPTGGILYLKQHFDRAEIHLYNLSGKEMGEYRIRFGQPVEISGYGSGMYLYRAVVDGKFYSGKIIRN